jgi:D-beta-D-heptose 7-phosphate kinase / D-beta-D-heptose 1-phosphate adenosyltransferase
MTARIVIVGDVLLDREIRGPVRRLCPDAPIPVVDGADERSRPGGAGLAAVLAARDGARVTLITAIGTDASGRQLLGLLEGEGVQVVNVGLIGTTPQKVRIGTADRSLLRLDLGGGHAGPGAEKARIHDHLADASCILVSDYGRGVPAESAVREAVGEAARTIPVVWDPHPNGPSPVAGVRIATPNEDELLRLSPETRSGLANITILADEARDRWKCGSVCVTRGERGAVLVEGSTTPLVVPSAAVQNADPCGAGDRFAVTTTLALAAGALVSEAVIAAVNSASQFVAAGGATGLVRHAMPRVNDLRTGDETASRAKSVVATGGCFDLLHAGHIALLAAASTLGDRLVVCLNSDASVRRLKGPGRPLVPAEDRAVVLRSIAGVDDVVVFDEDTPERVLEELKPDLFVKGADYAGAQLPEADVVARWGGRTIVLPYLEGRSTSAIVKEAIKRAQQ